MNNSSECVTLVMVFGTLVMVFGTLCEHCCVQDMKVCDFQSLDSHF